MAQASAAGGVAPITLHLVTIINPAVPANLALARRGGPRSSNEFYNPMSEMKAGTNSRLYDEFAQFYAQERCPWAPTNPRRVFDLAFGKTFRAYRKTLSREQVLAAVYDTLGFRGAERPGLFQTFDPARYSGSRPYEDHFLSLFARKLRGKLSLMTRRTTDGGREGDTTKFRPNPALGLLRKEERPASEQALLDDIPAVLDCLDARERGVIHLVYWADLSARKVGALLGMDHKTVARVHDQAVGKLRRLYGVEENLAA